MTLKSPPGFTAPEIAIFAKKTIGLNILCFMLSAIALGFCIRAWYIFRNFDNSLLTIFLVSLACVIYLWIFYILAHIPLFEKYFTAFFWIYFIISFIAYFLIMAFTKTTYISTFGYYMLIEMAFIFALCAESENANELVRSLTLSSYSVYIVAVIILICMYGGGDGFSIDGLDIGKKKPLREQELYFK
jgi:hypothetical protein